MSAYHTPVLLSESIAALAIQPSGIYVDVTFGGGGHSRTILEALGPRGQLFAFDRDADALQNVPQDSRFTLIHNNFKYMHACLRYAGCTQVQGILADLGVSSHQFDTQDRGFSFRFDAPLDMRMNRQGALTAAELLNTAPQEELERIFRQYGEMPQSRKMAALLVAARQQAPITHTQDLSRILAPLMPKQQAHKFQATLFQALRIEVNGEMAALEALLEQSLMLLAPGGRLVVISYHSLEDRMVKNFMRSGNLQGQIEKDFYGNELSPFTLIGRKAQSPSEQEIENNNRARSAKLRVAEKRQAS
jgi:S-adenosyl-methyltransferase MraW